MSSGNGAVITTPALLMKPSTRPKLSMASATIDAAPSGSATDARLATA